MTDYVIILSDDSAVEAFTGEMGNFTVGAEADIAVSSILRNLSYLFLSIRLTLDNTSPF